MENQSVSINMQQPYGRNGAGSPAIAFGPTATTFVRQEPVPNAQDFVLWSFFNAMFCNPCCLGFVALVYSIKARDKKIAQDPAGAVGFGRTAKQLNIAALCLGLIFFITIIVLAVLFRSQNPHGV
ncbi:interferon-induced transmembrane protein 1-like isoform X1 [Calypte anna]|uniref:interferon-induced transmembrane protein 1-like isoform X1 n=1 Tax=Calypte anna TaxID=9244 RepID=UPI0011C4852B|nr:interferon-induced transmembrane protein 1-like isoform X1 [Calypte anna]